MKRLFRNNSLAWVVMFAFLLLGGLGVLGWQVNTDSAGVEGNGPGEQEQQIAGPAGQGEGNGEETEEFRDRNDRLVSIGESIPGFGGMYIDPVKPDVLNVFLLDTEDGEQQAEVAHAIEEEFPGAIPPGGIAVVQGDYGIAQLKFWYDDLRYALGQSELMFNGLTFTDLSEHNNRLTVGVSSEALIPRVEELAGEAGLPQGLVRVVVMGPFRQLNGSASDTQPEPNTTIRDKIRPIIGGVQTQGED